MSNSELSAIQHLTLLAGNLGMPGAPILHLSVLYNSETGHLNGEAVITQAIAPPNGRIVIKNVTGLAHGLGIGGATRVFSLSGEYVQSFPPPAIGQITEKFSAIFTTDNAWKGHGTFSYGGNTVNNVPIKQQG